MDRGAEGRAERFFFLLTLIAYIRFARGSKWFYGAALGCFALGLMAKPMIVTLPCVLLLDVWPLGRLNAEEGVSRGRRLGRLLLEKAPFFALAIGSSIITVIAQEREGALAQLSRIPMKARLVNGEMTYWRYLQRTFWPHDLGATYPYEFTGRNWSCC